MRKRYEREKDACRSISQSWKNKKRIRNIERERMMKKNTCSPSPIFIIHDHRIKLKIKVTEYIHNIIWFMWKKRDIPFGVQKWNIINPSFRAMICFCFMQFPRHMINHWLSTQLCKCVKELLVLPIRCTLQLWNKCHLAL